MFKKILMALSVISVPFVLFAADFRVPMHLATADGVGAQVGEVVITESEYGLVFTPSFSNIAPGIHGFHVHENPSCDPIIKDGVTTPAGAAGGHFDPTNSKAHKGPFVKDGHLGDLPALYANTDGRIVYPVLAPKIKKLDEIKGRSLMLHVGGDNHEDQPAVLGGGGARLACGIIK